MTSVHQLHPLSSESTLRLAHFYRRRLASVEHASIWFLCGVGAQGFPLIDRLSCWSVSTPTWSPAPIAALPILADAIGVTCLLIGLLTLLRAPRARR